MDRQRYMLERLAEVGFVKVSELADDLAVSEMTIRRDLESLEKQGTLKRVYGGAIDDRRRSYEPPFALRALTGEDEKQRLGKAAADLAEPGQSLSIDFGTTAIQIARHLSGRDNLTVVTSNLRAAFEFAETPGVRVVLGGGIMRAGELSVVGKAAEQTFADYLVDVAFIGAAGITGEHGITDFNSDEVTVKRAMLRASKRVVGVVDGAKLGKVGLIRVAPLTALDVLVTTTTANEELVNEIAGAGIKTIVV